MMHFFGTAAAMCQTRDKGLAAMCQTRKNRFGLARLDQNDVGDVKTNRHEEEGVGENQSDPGMRYIDYRAIEQKTADGSLHVVIGIASPNNDFLDSS